MARREGRAASRNRPTEPVEYRRDGRTRRDKGQCQRRPAAGVELLSMVAEAGVPLARFQRDRPSLEDIFLELVEGNGGAE